MRLRSSLPESSEGEDGDGNHQSGVGGWPSPSERRTGLFREARKRVLARGIEIPDVYLSLGERVQPVLLDTSPGSSVPITNRSDEES
jgi:hypothetical protein